MLNKSLSNRVAYLFSSNIEMPNKLPVVDKYKKENDVLINNSTLINGLRLVKNRHEIVEFILLKITCQ